MMNLTKILEHTEQSSAYLCPEPMQYLTSKIDDRDFTVHIEDGLIQLDFENTMIRKSVHEIVTKFAHEFVLTYLGKDTDKPLSIIKEMNDFTDKQTPDFIDTDKKIVFEFATSVSSDERTLGRKFSHKKMVYDNSIAVRGEPYVFYILIVSSKMVVTNLKLPQSVVDQLCIDFQLSQKIKRQIIEKMATNPFEDKTKTEEFRHIKAILASMEIPVDEDGEFFDNEFLDRCRYPDSYTDKEYFQEILRRTYEKAKLRNKTPSSVVDEWNSKFDNTNSQINSKKRIQNFPFIYSERTQRQPIFKHMELGENINTPSHLYSMWSKSFLTAPTEIPEDKDREEVISHRVISTEEEKELKRARKKQYTVNIRLDELEQIELAKSGVQGKHLESNKEVKADRLMKKKSIHPDSYIEDINSFLEESIIEDSEESFTSEDWFGLIKLSKSIYNNPINEPEFNSVKIFQQIKQFKIIKYLDMISEIATELILASRQNLHMNNFIVKCLRNYGVNMLIKTTQLKSHIFVSLCFNKKDSIYFDTGRLGPTIYETENCYIVDFSSFMIPKLDHMVQASPLFSSLFIHLMHHYGLDPMTTDIKSILNEHFWRTLKFLMLVFLANKSGVEELMTDQRYLFMATQNCVITDPYAFIARFPSVIRNRLECWLIKKLTEKMHYLSITPLISKIVQSDNVPSIEFENLPSLYTDLNLTFSQKVNEFYFGYVVSKNKNPQGNTSFAMIEKITKLEFLFRDDCDKRNFGKADPLEPKPHEYSFTILNEMCSLVASKLKKMLGENWRDVLEDETISRFSKVSFEDLATLKASARKAEIDETIDLTKEDSLTSDHSHLFTMRPKAIEALSELSSEYEAETGKQLNHIFELVPFSLKRMEQRGGFIVDLFMKDQHGGNREIYVLEIMARVCQFFVEQIARVICSQFESETLTHPKNKTSIPITHEKKTLLTFKQAVSLCKSADASKWSQCHFVTKFAQMMFAYTNPIFHALIWRVCRLWVKKRIALPIELVKIFIKHQNNKSDNKYFTRVRDTFLNGTEMFSAAGSIHMNVQSGMMQGILHLVSSACHMTLQEASSMIIQSHAKYHNLDITISIMESSDDSGMMIGMSLEQAFKQSQQILTYHMWKDYLGLYVSIIPSKEKTTNAAINMLEYNSTWTHMGKTIMPTIRWVIAALSMTVTETFIERLRIFSNLLTECLEGGASTLECAVIQISQAWLHYKLLGCDTHALFSQYVDKLRNFPDPSRGFFPLDPDYCAGLFGLEFNFYCLCKRTIFGNFIKNNLNDKIGTSTLDSIRITLGGVMDHLKVSFSNREIWERIVKKMKLPDYETARTYLDENPDILYTKQTNWSVVKYNLISKLHTSSVVASISSHSPVARMIAASVYLISRPAVSFRTDGEFVKMSLMKSLGNFDRFDIPLDKTDLKVMFPYYQQYEMLLNLSDVLCKNSFVMNANYVRRSKISVEILEPNFVDTFHIRDVCARKWFGTDTVHVGSGYFSHLWNLFKQKYTWLRDTHDETKEYLQMDSLQLRTFFEQSYKRGRYVTLIDTTARKGESGIRDVISRIFWPAKKVVFTSDYEATEMLKAATVRANLYSLLTFPFHDDYKKHKVVSVIKDTDELGQISQESSKKYSVLRIFYDFLNNYSNESDLIEMIIQHKLGTIGYFSIRQSHDGSQYYGKGEWIGSINGIDTKLFLRDNQCTRIEMGTITNLKEGSYGLRQIFKDLKLEVNRENTKFNTYAFDGKNILSNVNGSIPIIVNSQFGFHVPDKLRDSQWDLQVKNNTIRIVVDIKRTTKRSTYVTPRERMRNSVTILSTTFSSRDLCFDSEVLIKSETYFNTWHKWRSLSVGEMFFMVNDLYNSKLDLGENIRRAKANKDIHYFNYEKLNRFCIRHLFRSLYRYEDYNKIQIAFEKDMHQDDEPDYELMEKFQDLNTYKDYLNLDSFKEDFKWSDMIDEEEVEIDDFPLDERFSEHHEALYNIMGNLSGQDFDLMFLNLESPHNLLMPLSHPYFDELMVAIKEKLLITDEADIYRDWKELNLNYRLPGKLGWHVSIMIGRYIMEPDDVLDSEPSEVRKSLKKIRKSISSMGSSSSSDIDTMTKEDLQLRINQIECEINDIKDSLSKGLTTKANKILTDSLQRLEDSKRPYEHELKSKYPEIILEEFDITEEFEVSNATLIRSPENNNSLYTAIYNSCVHDNRNNLNVIILKATGENHVQVIKTSIFSYSFQNMSILEETFGSEFRQYISESLQSNHIPNESELYILSQYLDIQLHVYTATDNVRVYGSGEVVYKLRLINGHFDCLI
ncbi:RNA-dependent RNA polymerase [Lettuce dieback associated virus]|nr:RNA-dependent RNA polymerase [Lettuce dieback associated virus]